MILVLRRNNPSPDGDFLELLVSALSAAGYQIQYVDTTLPHAVQLDVKFKSFAKLIRHQSIVGYLQKPRLKRFLTRSVKTVFLLVDPRNVLPFFKERRRNSNFPSPDYVRYLVEQINAEPVHLIAQSAGGITAALVSSHPKVKSLLCIGYPLKYPNKKPQKYRTKPLQSISAPCLIVQGDKDEYGAISDIRKYKISNNVKFLEIMADHSYKNITDEDMAKVYQAVVQLIQRGDAPNSYPVC
jgi:uncharacterized protein